MRGVLVAILLAWPAFWCGCRSKPGPVGPPRIVELDLLPVQQMRAYDQAATGRFVALADLEDHPGLSAAEQAGWFSIQPAQAQGQCQRAMNITRTGIGALAVTLPVGSALALDIPDLHDFVPYTLLSLAIHSPVLRDDLRVTLDSARGSWTSPRQLIRPGWNTVLVDLKPARQTRAFDLRRVLRVRLGFDSAGGPVSLYLDDVMLIDNRRRLVGGPAGLKVGVYGLDWHIHLPGRDDPLMIRQGQDGLWRLSDQPVLRLGTGNPSEGGEDIGLMGDRRIGSCELLECNPIRVCLANTWYMPSRAGEWLSLAVRQIRWEYTIYHDGRWVTHLEINNAGGPEIGWLSLRSARPVAWADGEVSAGRMVNPFLGPIWRCDYASVPGGGGRPSQTSEYLSPGRLAPAEGSRVGFASGDRNRDGFDESQGCYSIAPRTGTARLTFHPGAEGMVDPVLMVRGDWRGPVSVNLAGRAVRQMIRLEDGDLLMILPGRYDQPVPLEIIGRLGP
jgi:hypothetical protein